MASARQVQANARNASGPHKMTEEGKAAVRGNAIRHGLATRVHVVLAGEDEALFAEIRESLLAQYTPATPQQELLVHQIAESHWRLVRARNMDAGTFKMGRRNLEEEFGVDRAEPDDLLRGLNLATVLAKWDELFSKVARYETTAERSYYRAIRELTRLQKEEIRSVRQNAESVSAKSQPAAPTTAPAAAPVVEIRSVPQNAPSSMHFASPQSQTAATEIENPSRAMSANEFTVVQDEIPSPKRQ